MKFILSVLFLLSAILIAATKSNKLNDDQFETYQSAESDENKCPDNDQINTCLCYEISHRIVCKKPLTAKFNLKHNYTINTLSIENIQDLSLIADHTVSEGKLHADALIITQTELSKSNVPSMQILKDVLSIATTSLKIISDKSEKNTDPLNIESINSDDLSSLVIQGVTNLMKFDVTKLKSLNRLEIIDTQLDPYTSNIADIVITDSSIKYLEFKNTNFDSSFSFTPNDCEDKTVITIILQSNKITNIDFKSLFPLDNSTTNFCHYHIELNNNENLDVDFFSEKQMESIKEFYKNSKNLFLVMKNNNPVSCSCKLFNLYTLNKQFIHGITCLNVNVNEKPQNRTIDELSKTNFKNCT